MATAAAQAVERIGMPEARILLSQAAVYVACAPKSNSSYMAVDAALEDVRNRKIVTIPPHLQDAHYNGAEKLGHGLTYQYAHSYPDHYVRQQYLPDELVDTVFYHPGNLGYEKQMAERLDYLRNKDAEDKV